MDPICKPFVPSHILFRRQVAWVKRNSKPKKVPPSPKIERGPKFTNPARLDTLAIPRHKYVSPKNDPTSWVYMLLHPVKEAAKSYVASGLIAQLAMPRWRKSEIPTNPPVRKLPGDGEMLCPPWVDKLSQPKIPYRKPKIRPLVKASALKYTASKRIKDLAEARKRQVEINEYAFTVNPIALTYLPSKRTRVMAKPHHVMTEEELRAQEEKHQQRKEAYDKKRAAKLEAKKEAIAKRHASERKALGL